MPGIIEGAGIGKMIIENANRFFSFAITVVVFLAISFSGAAAQLSQRPITIAGAKSMQHD